MVLSEVTGDNGPLVNRYMPRAERARPQFKTQNSAKRIGAADGAWKISINFIPSRAHRLRRDECHIARITTRSHCLPGGGRHLLRGFLGPDAISPDFWRLSTNRKTPRRACPRTPRPICPAVALESLDSNGAAYHLVLRHHVCANGSPRVLAAPVRSVPYSRAIAGLYHLVARVFASPVSCSRGLA